MTEKNMVERGCWSSQLGFVLAATGSAVGLGNIWKFPYITHQNGGGAFVLVYLLCTLWVGLPIMLAEIFMGKKSNKDPMGAYRFLAPGSRFWPLVGAVGILAGFVILSYYSVVSGWVLHYVIASFMGKLQGLNNGEVADYFNTFAADGPKQLMYHGTMMVICTFIVMQGVKGGIERANRIFMPLLLGILGILTGYSVVNYAGKEAAIFLFNPENFKSLSAHGVLEALGHSFFTLSLGMGAMITYGSYMPEKEEVMPSGVWIVLADVLISLTACFLIYSILFSFDEEVQGGPGLLFVTLPRLIEQMTGHVLFSGLFFVLVLFAALTSAISLLEVVVAFFHDELGLSRRMGCLVAAGSIFLLGIPCALSLGPLSDVHVLGRNPFDFLDYLASNWLLPIGGLFCALFIGWVVDERILKQELSRKWPLLYPGWLLIIRYVTPCLVVLVVLKTTGALDGVQTFLGSLFGFAD